MSVHRSISRGVPNQALLCWSEAPYSFSREEFVQVLESHLSEAVIKSALKVSEETNVTLIGKDYTGIGIVKSCRKDGESFILTIRMEEDQSNVPRCGDVDPGVLTVDNFLTEEQEAKILDDLEEWSGCWQLFARCRWRGLRGAFTLPSGSGISPSTFSFFQNRRGSLRAL